MALRCALVVASLVVACDSQHDDEEVAEASFALSGLKPEQNLTPSLTGNNRFNQTAAWIRQKNDSGNGQRQGMGLVAFTNTETAGVGDRVAWAFSLNWAATTPTWTVQRSNATGARWPAPDNLCEVFAGANECSGSGGGWNQGTTVKGKFQRAANTLYTGLNEIGAIVGTSGFDTDHEDVFIAVTVDGGQTVAHTHLLTVADEIGTDTGIDVDPDSVHASTAAFGEVTTPRNGEIALPIYVTWRQRIGSAPQWWWTRVLVGVSGTVAEVMEPKKLNFVPAVASTHASIFGYRKLGVEHVGVAWSKRGSPATAVTCPSASTFTMEWIARESPDFGQTWDCFDGNHSTSVGFPLPFEGCNTTTKETTIASDPTWKPCVGPIVGSRQASTNHRPEVGMNMPALPSDPKTEDEQKKFWTFVVNKSTPSGMRVCSYRTGGDPNIPFQGFMWDVLYDLPCSGNVDPGGATVADAWGQSIGVMNASAQNSQTTILIKESFTTSPQGIRMLAMELDGDVDITFAESRVTTDTTSGGNTVPFTFDNDPGTRTGVAVYQKCDLGIPGCPGSTSFTYPDLPVFGAWPDTRVNATTRNDTFVRSWLW